MSGTEKNRATPVKMSDIAEALGISVATVSLALRGISTVADQTRRRVIETADALGYVYNRSAARMRSAQTNIISLIINNLDNVFASQFIVSLESRVNDAGCGLMMGVGLDDPARFARLARHHVELGTDGLLLSPAAGLSLDDIGAVRRSGTAIVQVYRELPDAGLDYAGFDFGAQTRLALDYLYALGHRRIATLSGPLGTSVANARLDAFRTFHADHGLGSPDDLFIEAKVSLEGGYRATSRTLSLVPRPTAIVCMNDSAAIGALTAIAGAGLTTPGDMSIIGFNDASFARLAHPRVTSVTASFATLAEVATKLLFRRIENSDAPIVRQIVPGDLMIGETTAAPRALP